MSKTRSLLTALTASGFLVACAGAPEPAAAPEPPCTFQDGSGPYTAKAPDWVCNEGSNVPGLTAVASYRQSSSGYDFMVEMATARGRQRLAAIISSEAEGSVKDYRANSGNTLANETNMATSEITQKTIYSAVLTGSRVVTKTRNPDTGQVYVLVGISDQDLPKLAEKAVETAFKNDDVGFQLYKASKSFKELISDLGN